MEDKDEGLTISKILQEEVEKRNWNAEMLRNRMIDKHKTSLCDLKTHTVKLWMEGKAYPDLDQTYKLAEVLGVNPIEIWELKLKGEEKEKLKNRGYVTNIIDRGLDHSQFLLMVMLYSFLFCAALFIAVSIRSYYKSIDYNEQQTEKYVEGAIDAGVEYAGNVTGDRQMVENYKKATSK